MGFLSHKVNTSDLEAGDHIYTWRTPVFAYSHHGIYVGGNKVVHFTQDQNLTSPNSFTSFSSSLPNISPTCLDLLDCVFKQQRSGVVISCLNCFLHNGSIYRFQYEVNCFTFISKLRGGTCTTAKSDPPQIVLHRAMHLLHNGFGNYDVFTNNCEDFALYCKTGLLCGRKASGGSGQASSVLGVPVAAILALPVRVFVSNPVVLGATTVVNYALNRYAADVGVRDDVVKVEVEDVAVFHGGLLPVEEDGVDIGESFPRKRKRNS